MTQLPLTYCPSRPLPHNGTPTSRAGAASVRPERASQQERLILDYLAGFPEGLTRKDIETGLPMLPNIVTARCNELVKKGLLQEDGTRKNPGSGVSAKVVKLRKEK